jgi:DNA-binding XRE family transcriptional regulator
MTGAEMREIRERWGISQADMAEALGVKGGRQRIWTLEQRDEIDATLAKLVRCLDERREG